MRTAFINCLIERARVDDRIFLITPDMGCSVIESFRDEFPDRFMNVGIAEQNAIGVASGLALSGKVVYVSSIIPFVTMRCFEQVRIDLAYMNTNVRLVGVGAGLTYGAQGGCGCRSQIMRSILLPLGASVGSTRASRSRMNASDRSKGEDHEPISQKTLYQ